MLLLAGFATQASAQPAAAAHSPAAAAVPAVVRHAIPEANPSLYFSLSLGITFPLNILFGIPLYSQVAHWAWGA